MSTCNFLKANLELKLGKKLKYLSNFVKVVDGNHKMFVLSTYLCAFFSSFEKVKEHKRKKKIGKLMIACTVQTLRKLKLFENVQNEFLEDC